MASLEQELETGLARLNDEETDEEASDQTSVPQSDDTEDAEEPVDAATRESWLAAHRAVARRRGGAIRSNQLGDALRLAGFVVTEAEVAQYRAEVDPNDEGSIGAEAFVALATKARHEVSVVGAEGGDFQTVRAALAVFDRQDSGRISAEDLRHWLTNLGEPVEDGDVSKMLEHLVDEQGQLDYAELAHRLSGL